MELTTEYASPAELTGFAREAVSGWEANRPSLARWLPYREIPDLQFKFTRGSSELIRAAAYRAYDAETRIGRRPGLESVSGELPPLGEKVRLTEYQQLKQRNLPGAIADAVYNDARRLVHQIVARLELARADALVNGVVTIAEDDMEATVDFGRDPAHAVTAATAWSNTAAPILDDLEAWAQAYVDANGALPAAILTSRRVSSMMMRNEQLRGQIAGTSAALVTRDQVNAVLASLGLPPVELYDAQFIDPSGVARRAIPDDRFMFLPEPGDPMSEPDENALGATLLGQTLEAEEPDYALEPAEQPGIVVGNFKSRDPIGLWTHAAAIGIPIVASPNATFVADVA
ncbi:major capsid protein [Nocardiopsis aegyptia]|uniref:major capsid protein n=1 Tax=Nocardiopsis aegyptia TaxID=220378 RepID=UPI00366DCB14